MIPAPSTNLNGYFRPDFYIREIPDVPANIVDWDTSSVTSAATTFAGFYDLAHTFNLDISGWDTGNVTNMRSMFFHAADFNHDIGGWNTSNVTDMAGMFSRTSSFNHDIGQWDTSNVTHLDSMFSLALAFNQDINGWDTSNVTDMSAVFRGATAFDQNLGDWDISSLRDGISLFDNSGMSMANFDTTLAGWASLDAGEARIPTGVRLGAEGLVYSNFDVFNTLTTQYDWVIDDALYYLAGSEDDDVLDGTDGAYRILIDGLAGNDHIIGNGFNDSLAGSDGSDTIEGGLGQDTLVGGIWDDFLYGANMQGAAENDLADRIFAGAGNDFADGGYGNDELRGDVGHDTLIGGHGADTLFGGAHDDHLTGSALGDVIFGGSGDDFINGGFGHDRLNGGAGADRFFHTGDAGHGSDWVQDYSAVEGDVLHYGGAATADQFQVNFAETVNAGMAGIAEAFVIHQPTGQILWALVDGQDQTEINIRIAGESFDLLG
jgi:surface protein